jgi:predicted acylesterase/phospholipase RssA/CRP-like cAMP-binding protein
MLDLSAIPFFSGLSEEGLRRTRAVAEERSFPTGTIVCRKGDEGRAVFFVAAGGLAVETGQDAAGGVRRVFLGPGEIVGEMSIVSGLPVSATVVSVQRSTLYRISRESFLTLLGEEAPLQLALTQMLMRRIRERTAPRGQERPRLALLVAAPGSSPAERFVRVVHRGVDRYCPQSPLETIPSAAEFGNTVSAWRESAGAGRYLVAAIDVGAASRVLPLLERGDVLVTTGDVDLPESLADRTRVVVEETPGRGESRRDGEWYFTVPQAEVDLALEAPTWDRRLIPDLDRLVRWITQREIGIALGSGAALGFAHLGVLEVLEDAGVPIDCLAGSSMGGIVALAYAREGNARHAMATVQRVIGARKKVRDVSWFPRSSLLLGAKARWAAREASGGLTLAQLRRPAYAVAADLARSQPVILDRGPMEQAFLATSAIPALFPPIEADGRFMVDGALVHRVPVSVLDRRRCGLRIAVHVVPSPASHGPSAEELRAGTARLFGFRDVLARSWGLLAWWHGAADAAAADILIEPSSAASSYDFDAFEAIVEDGRRAAREKLGLIGAAVEEVIGRG